MLCCWTICTWMHTDFPSPGLVYFQVQEQANVSELFYFMKRFISNLELRYRNLSDKSTPVPLQVFVQLVMRTSN
jgi:hypothetical protein